MLKHFNVMCLVALSVALMNSPCGAMGEEILAHTGQFTFFIKPVPGSHTTYYQRTVPCVASVMVPVPRHVTNTYPVPVPVRRHLPVMVSETPMGCAEGQGPCVECYPRPSRMSASREVWAPNIIPVSVPGTQFVPKHVTRRIKLPQWFEVTEEPSMPKPIRKVASDG
jgi:hypothetical protein